jgi:hypothetical protein
MAELNEKLKTIVYIAKTNPKTSFMGWFFEILLLTSILPGLGETFRNG